MFLCSEQPAPLSTAAEAKSVLVSPAASPGPGTQSSLDKCPLNEWAELENVRIWPGVTQREKETERERGGEHN